MLDVFYTLFASRLFSRPCAAPQAAAAELEAAELRLQESRLEAEEREKQVVLLQGESALRKRQLEMEVKRLDQAPQLTPCGHN